MYLILSNQLEALNLKAAQSCLTPWAPMDYTMHGNLQASLGSLSLLQGELPNQGVKPRSPALQMDSLPSELPGKPIESIISI